jgi:transposase
VATAKVRQGRPTLALTTTVTIVGTGDADTDARRRHIASGRNTEPTAAIIDSRTLRSTPESGQRAGYDGAKRKRGSKLHLAVDTLGQLLALHATPANIDDRAQVGRLAEAIQDATGETVTLVYVDQGYTGDRPAEAASAQGIALEVVPEAKRSFVLLPRRWVVERSFAWQLDAADWSRTTNDTPVPWPVSTSSPSHASCSSKLLYSPQVHNTLLAISSTVPPIGVCLLHDPYQCAELTRST